MGKIAKKISKARIRKNKKVEKRNKKFRKMSRMEQRVALAKEVLSIVNRKSARFKLSRAFGYITATVSQKAAESFIGRHEDWQTVLPKLEECQVCMIGLGAVAAIRKRDGAPVNQFGSIEIDYEKNGTIEWSQDECRDVLRDLFDENELIDMEAFFEKRSHSVPADEAARIVWGSILESNGVYHAETIRELYEKEANRRYAKQEKRRKAMDARAVKAATT